MKRAYVNQNIYFRFLFILTGISATLWFLIRVIPKPGRASYPCMKVASPIMASFFIYAIGVTGSWLFLKKIHKALLNRKYITACLFLIGCIFSWLVIDVTNNERALAGITAPLDNVFPVASNEPVGTARGLFPGRVIWVHEPGATNENYNPVQGSSDYWYSNANANEDIIKAMLIKGIQEYAGKDNLAEAWEAIFTSFNASMGNGNVGYTPGEKIAFKINLTNQSAGSSERPLRMDATPQLLNAILDQLVNVVGVAQTDIIMGDPYREFRKEYRDLVKAKFPNVYYVDGKGANGIHQTVPTSNEILVFSDKKYKSTLPKQYVDAHYLINIACLKTHDEGGITLLGKNHQGSYLKKGDSPAGQSAFLMHYSLQKNNAGSGKYRHTVDYLGHDQTFGKGLIYIVDGIWAGESWQGWIKKFKSAPFNNDYPSSILLGQDPVALESVGYDILFEEYQKDPGKVNYPNLYKAEIADYLKQCASSEFWPAGVSYDPEGDGTLIGSLGVFEHWNNATDRKYSRNLGTGSGIEMKYFTGIKTGIQDDILPDDKSIAYPNPFFGRLWIRIPEDFSDHSILEIRNLQGKMLLCKSLQGNGIEELDLSMDFNNNMPEGIYIFSIIHRKNQQRVSGKIIFKH